MFGILPLAGSILIGWACGSLVNYLSDVLPEERALARPACTECQAYFGLMNYLIWPQRCQNCGKRRPARAWIVYLIFILTAYWLWVMPGGKLPDRASLVVLAYFGLVAVIDIEHRLILHPVSLVGAGIGLLVGSHLHGLAATILGGLAGFGIMLALYGLGIGYAYLAAKRKGETQFEDALGFGDVNLAGVIGLMLGWPGVLAGIVLAILLAGGLSLVYVIVMLVARRYHSSLAIPYGPFLVASAVILLFFGQELARWAGG
jgi:leader peptidase (prepilin peptidase) / N-methyltransferase